MSTRHLTDFERGEAQKVFGASIHYDRVRIVEGSPWTNFIAKVGARINREPTPKYDNAVTLGNTSHFPRALKTNPGPSGPESVADLAWMIHELTHVWQYQHTGAGYVVRALRVDLTLGIKAYDYGGEQGLREARAAGRHLADFNPEQQGDIARHYYTRVRHHQDPSAWEPFIEELRRA
jgi:hypothetical protein